MKLKIVLIFLLALPLYSFAQLHSQLDYEAYHRQIIKAEEWIADEKYAEAITTFEAFFGDYNFIFLRDYKVAAQLAFFINQEQKAFEFLKQGLANGLTLKEIKKNKWLKLAQHKSAWKTLKSQYPTLHEQYLKRLDQNLRAEVKDMFKDDQKLALANLFIFGANAKERFLQKKIIPQSEKQVIRLQEILQEKGYPGEKLIGADAWHWMWTILCHHNSISSEYAQKDTLYSSLKPQLLTAIQRGELHPYDYAIIEDWYVAVKSNRKEAAYGYLNPLTLSELPQADALNEKHGMRSIALRNRLVDIQVKTGLNFYLAGSFWNVEKIEAVEKR